MHPTHFLYSPIQRQFLVFGELYDAVPRKDEGEDSPIFSPFPALYGVHADRVETFVEASFESAPAASEQKGKSLLKQMLKESSGPPKRAARTDKDAARLGTQEDTGGLMSKFKLRTYSHLPLPSVKQRWTLLTPQLLTQEITAMLMRSLLLPGPSIATGGAANTILHKERRL